MQTDQQIVQRLDTMAAQLAELTEHQRASAELFEEMTPIAREMLGVATARLEELDRQGLFDAMATLVQLVRALTRPEVLRIAGDAIAALEDAEHAKPLGAFRAVRSMRDDDVQKGVGVLIDVLRRIGHGVNGDGAVDGKQLDQRVKLAELIGPRRARQLPAPRAAVPAAAPIVVTRAPAQIRAAGPASAEPAAIDPSAWTRELGAAIARESGIELDAARWALVDAARADFATTKASPNIQRLTGITHITTKDLYQLFPKAPARTIAKIAGLPKPSGCL